MGEKYIWNFLGSLFSSMFGFGSNIFTNMMNKRYQDEANKTNLEIARQTNEANMQMTAATNLANRELVREQNAAAAAEAEKAYQRSKPTTQVANMQAAGMSLAGAINSLNGGGSYSPAPVNVSSDESSRYQSAQVSPAQLMSSEGVFANIANAFMQREQIKSSERMHKDNLKQQAAEAQKQREHELLLSDIQSGNQVQHDYLEYEKHRQNLEFEKLVYNQAAPLREKQLAELDARIEGLKASTTQTKIQSELLELQKELQSNSINYDKLRIRSEALTSAAQGELDRLMIAQRRGALFEMDSEELRSFLQYKMRLELASMISDAIKDEQWNKNKVEGKLKILKFIDDFLVGVKK